ncbi:MULTISPECIES: hypothetical protein [Asanoa]|uniref:Uncharacterized protein n=2 Tax=Asanoa TaxID=195964 RepID=A0A239PGJ9_9ACTN|nr:MULTISPECIES: hypothetical protein [Asanoa]GIF74214.1 hypothetical protein Asi02nite_37320 [Asanoa siamensis]SNT65728.1 hypothetical protein SAMN05421812_12571 [Asanoa hainanensis]
MEQRIVDGQPATDRAGAAEYLGMPAATVSMYSSPGQRARRGWPDPLPDRLDGRDWFAIAALDVYRARRNPDPQPAPLVDDPDELIGREQFAKLRGVKAATMTSYVTNSLPDWDRGQDGYLPLPDVTETARHGSTYLWTRRRALEWVFPTAPRRSSGRPPAARTVTLDDLKAVLAAAGADAPAMSQRALAAALTDRIGAPVSIQTVKRLRAKQRNSDAQAAH